MATGIVSSALRLAGYPDLSAGLVAVAAAAFAVLLAVSAYRAAAFPGCMLADLACPRRAFTCFAFTAAGALLGARAAADDQRVAAAVLTAMALAIWLALTWLVPGRLAGRDRAAITDVNGSWYLWAVATQALAIAAAGQAGRPGWGWLAASAAVAGWAAGVMLYGAITGLVTWRLRRAPLTPQDPTAPYWVAMGAASISVLAAAQILRSPAAASLGAPGRRLVTGLAAGLWALATCLVPPLTVRSAWRHLHARVPVAYRADLWMIVFPAGMYATASMQLGTASRLPVLYSIGAAVTWPAAAAWALVFAAMIVSGTRAAWRSLAAARTQ